MSAAIEAAELDDEVILVSPVQSERTQSVMAAEGINAVVDTAEEDSVVWHANDTLESGCFLEKEEDVRNLCEKAPEHLKWLDEMGVLFDRNEDDTWKVKASGGQSRKRTVYSGNSIGKQIVTAMTQKCRLSTRMHPAKPSLTTEANRPSGFDLTNLRPDSRKCVHPVTV